MTVGFLFFSFLFELASVSNRGGAVFWGLKPAPSYGGAVFLREGQFVDAARSGFCEITDIATVGSGVCRVTDVVVTDVVDVGSEIKDVDAVGSGFCEIKEIEF